MKCQQPFILVQSSRSSYISLCRKISAYCVKTLKMPVGIAVGIGVVILLTALGL
jgi:hypothetical protein